MTKNEIKKVLLHAVGNPSVGVIKEAAEVQAQAIFDALNPTKAEKPKKETASIEPEETR